MNDETFSRILNNCLDRLAAGESITACLAHYPQHADELAPLLTAAGAVSALRGYHISDAGRQQARAKILRAEVAANESRASRFWRWSAFGFGVPRLAVGLIVALLCLWLTSAAVMASKPGDLAYGVRVVVERAPVVLAQGAEARARAELGIAERRLGDLDRLRSSQNQELDERTVTALLHSAVQAAVLAVELPDEQRVEIAGRLTEQAERLVALEAVAPPGAVATLGAAARNVQRAAEHAQPQPPAPGKLPVTGPARTPALQPSATATPTSVRPARVATGKPTRGAVVTDTVRPTHTPARLRTGSDSSAIPKRAGPRATPQGPSASATPRRLGPRATAQVPGPNGTPQDPRPDPSSPRPGPSATPQGPGPIPTAPVPGPSATPQGPGPNPTSAGPGPNPTLPGPGLDVTPQGPGPNPTSPGPGPNVTPQGPGPNPTSPGPDTSATSECPGGCGTPQGPGRSPRLAELAEVQAEFHHHVQQLPSCA